VKDSAPKNAPASRDPDGARLRDIADQVSRVETENSRLLERLAETERRFHRISRGVLRAQEEERGRISRDLHDGVGQSLTALKIQLELLEEEASRLAPSLAARIESARQLAAGCLADVREMSRLLRPQMLDELGLEPTLRWLARTLQERTGLPIALEYRSGGELADADVQTLVFRLVQEALTNVIRHARAGTASVTIEDGAEAIRVRVEDDGCGFDVAAALAARDPEEGSGVRAMRDRVHSFRGHFRLRSGAQGTVLEAEIPLDDRRGEGGA